MTSVFIQPGCPQAPSQVAGLKRLDRLHQTLKKLGWEIVHSPQEASLRIKDCELPLGDKIFHLCEMKLTEIEKTLLHSLKKPIDGLISKKINRPFSLFLTKLLMNHKVHPNVITLITLTLGVLSGLLVSLKTYPWMVTGALLLQLQSMIDGVDGELARLKFQTSKLGEWLDTVSDDVAEFSFLVGLTYVFIHSPYQVLGLIGIFSFLLGKLILYYNLIFVYQSGDHLAFEWNIDKGENSLLKNLKLLFKHDFLCFLYLLLILITLPEIALIIMSAGYIIFFFSTCLQLKKS